MAEEKIFKCGKCGADLIRDTERQLYRCDFCGVAYGFSLGGDLMEKAKHSLTLREYADADLLYSHILTWDQTNLEALRGRVLCAGRINSISDIRNTGGMSGARRDAITKRCNEAMLVLSDEKKEYFGLIKKAVDVQCQIDLIDRRTKPLTKKRDKIQDEVVSVDSRLVEQECRQRRESYRNFSITGYLIDRAFDSILGESTTSESIRSTQDTSEIMHSSASNVSRKISSYQSKKLDLSTRMSAYMKRIAEIESEF